MIDHHEMPNSYAHYKYSDKEIEIPESDAINQIKKLIKLDD